MIEQFLAWLRRRVLVYKGLSCDRSRRQIYDSDWGYWLDCSQGIRALILLIAFAAVVRIGMWHADYSITQAVVMGLVLISMSALALPLIARDVWRSNQFLTLTMSCLIINLLINKSFYLLFENHAFYGIALSDMLVPSALGTILLTILISPQAGVFLALALPLADMLFLTNHFHVLTQNLLIGFAGVLFARKIRRRSNLMVAGLLVGIVGMAGAWAQGFAGYLTPQETLIHSAWSLILGTGTVFVVGAILPILEWSFDRVTDISWLELTDLNHPLLKKLTLEAPGTYHHSLMVANLAEAAAESVGANPTMCRVMAYFHDVGKLTKPSYFIENSSSDQNPHEGLTPSMSALIIMAHVKEGVDLALKYGLPRQIIEGIQQHHGTSLIYYFYRKALQQLEDARAGSEILKLRADDMPDVEESSFRYPGPIPQYKETAILSLADSIESASRNLRNPTQQAVEGLVEQIVKNRIEDGQLDDCDLTLQEIKTISERFVFTLKTMLHVRVDYPKEKNGDSDKDYSHQQAKTIPFVHFPATQANS